MARIEIEYDEEDILHFGDEEMHAQKHDQQEEEEESHLDVDQQLLVAYAGGEDSTELAVQVVFGRVHHAVVGWLEVGVEGLEALARAVDGQLQA